jgi:transcriptional regulator with XRE-family HTH domain
MELALDEQIARISKRIRRWREDDDLTLQELAERGGLATSTVQKVETGQMMPSLAVLLKLAHGLGRRIGEMLEDSDTDVDVFHSKACERESVRSAGSQVVERLSGNLVGSSLETWQVTLEPGASSGSDPIQYDGEEVVVCEAGRVTFRLGEEEYALQAGDSLHFRSSIPHSWYNDGASAARFTITGTVPMVFRNLMQSRTPTARIKEHPAQVSLVS